MDSKKHSALTGSQVKVSRIVGGAFSIYDGEIEGINLELIPDKKIVQSWRYSDWPESHLSEVTFLLSEESGNTHLDFTQLRVPDEHYQDIREGWQDYYWTPMKDILEGYQKKGE
jgi:activator of HSP90 ATPase